MMNYKRLMCNHLDKPLQFVHNFRVNGDQADGEWHSVWQCLDCGEKIIRNQPFVQGEVSDGYHTFNELYHHRAVLFSVICNDHKDIAWKSKRHSNPDDEMYPGMFIVGLETPEGQATYHYDIDPYWDMFKVKELESAPEWDGHTPEQAIERIASLSRE